MCALDEVEAVAQRTETQQHRVPASRKHGAACEFNVPGHSSMPCAVLPPQDLPGALSDAQIAEGLGLHDIKNRPWAIFRSSAVKGEGLFEGLDWLSNMLKSKR